MCELHPGRVALVGRGAARVARVLARGARVARGVARGVISRSFFEKIRAGIVPKHRQRTHFGTQTCLKKGSHDHQMLASKAFGPPRGEARGGDLTGVRGEDSTRNCPYTAQVRSKQ